VFYTIKVGFCSSVNDEVKSISRNCKAFVGITLIFQTLFQFYVI